MILNQLDLRENMVLLINYADKNFKTSQKLNSKTGIETGKFDKVISYSPKDIDRDFYRKNRHILEQKRGNGFWLWKPYFIKRSLERLKEGEFLFYCDSGALFLNPITPVIEMSVKSEQDIIPFELTHIEKEWTKRDAFVLMGCDLPEYTQTLQRHCGYSLWKKTEFSLNFLDEFLCYAQDERIITDNQNSCGLPNYPEFRDHRHDQSIFSLLTKKHGLKAFTSLSEEPRRIIEHTRKRDVPFKNKIRRKFRFLRKKLFEKNN